MKKHPMKRIQVRHEAPSNGWLPIRLTVSGREIVIVASDVPNNPVQELLETLESAARGSEASVWWHLEPDGYYLRFFPIGGEIKLVLEFAAESKACCVEDVLSIQGTRAEVLLPFWRFLREFQSYDYSEPDWPSVDYRRIAAVREAIGISHED
ncbi:hypothetical protein [Duganella sp. CF458]|uniref:hypothetical protein n=1 Tax=Duganella sp. CF458 TaxID=1884368 RepID=UPI00147D4024|nr:hypothetical protein [Duganella sp. CF458]